MPANDYDDEIGPFETFGRSVDLFGDGSVRLVFTPGHSLGHQSLILRLAGGHECLLCSDAAYEIATIHDTVMPTIMADWSQAAGAARMAARRHAALK